MDGTDKGWSETSGLGESTGIDEAPLVLGGLGEGL